MSPESSASSTLGQLYRNRIGDPRTDDEVLGYWVFVLGLILGVIGVLLVVASRPTVALRQVSVALGSAGLVLLVVGPIIRLPLQRRATTLVYLGGAISALAIVWFLVTFPGDWTPQAGNPGIIGLYSLGLLVIALGGVGVPLLTGRDDLEAELATLHEAMDELEAAMADMAADEADIAARVRELRDGLQDAEAEEGDLSAAIARLRGEADDAAADEADLAAQLRSLRASKARFELYEDRGDEWRWRLRHRNGNTVATSGQGYTRRHNAQKGLESVRANAPGATVLLIESEDDLPEEGEPFEPVEEAPSRTTFELFEDNSGDHRWRLRHDNGNIVADSAEGYSSKGGAREALDRVKEYAGPGEYLRIDPTAFEIYRDRAGGWRWRLVHKNGNILADSGQSYTRRRDARRAVDRIQDGIEEMSFEVYEDSAGEFRWRLESGDDVMADSGQGYHDESEANDAVDRVREYAPEADALDIGWAAFEVYEDSAGEYRWRLRHRNANIMADGGEGYDSRSAAEEAVDRFKLNAPNADSETID